MELDFEGIEDLNEDKREVVVIHAVDWCYYESQAPASCGLFNPIEGVIVGILVEETEDKIVLAHQWFPEQDEVRHVTSIPMGNIIEIHRVTVNQPE